MGQVTRRAASTRRHGCHPLYVPCCCVLPSTPTQRRSVQIGAGHPESYRAVADKPILPPDGWSALPRTGIRTRFRPFPPPARPAGAPPPTRAPRPVPPTPSPARTPSFVAGRRLGPAGAPPRSPKTRRFFVTDRAFAASRARSGVAACADGHGSSPRVSCRGAGRSRGSPTAVGSSGRAFSGRVSGSKSAFWPSRGHL